jgi:hypothetical protein
MEMKDLLNIERNEYEVVPPKFSFFIHFTLHVFFLMLCVFLP